MEGLTSYTTQQARGRSHQGFLQVLEQRCGEAMVMRLNFTDHKDGDTTRRWSVRVSRQGKGRGCKRRNKEKREACVYCKETENFSPKSHSKNQAGKREITYSGEDGSSEDRVLSVLEENNGITYDAI